MPREVDYNLLRALQALLEERSVTRAAERLRVSQPAASAALAKLRRHFADDLLVRSGNGYERTPLAARLLERAARAVGSADHVFSLQPDFDAATSERAFTLMLSDYSIAVLGGPLSHLLAAQAPRVRLHLRQVTAEAVDSASEALGRIDAFLLPHGFLTSLPYEDLLQDEWACLVSTDNQVVGDELTRHDLGALPWVSVFHRPTAFTTAIRELRMHGIEPDVQLVTESYSTLPALIAGTNRITLIQRRLTAGLDLAENFRVLPCPVPLASLNLAMWWHPTHTADAGHQWLRALVGAAAERSG
ncbi:LysR family transcriptional regulator [Streptomyces sp. NPDC091271]|uniref:LysR family transcriptional regulator n=1 Tax=Streptomyces sp. NPDC091271 TaxID=3365980 RepID=UPI0037F94CB9